jgi:hypothetical protein
MGGKKNTQCNSCQTSKQLKAKYVVVKLLLICCYQLVKKRDSSEHIEVKKAAVYQFLKQRCQALTLGVLVLELYRLLTLDAWVSYNDWVRLNIWDSATGLQQKSEKTLGRDRIPG